MHSLKQSLQSLSNTREICAALILLWSPFSTAAAISALPERHLASALAGRAAATTTIVTQRTAIRGAETRRRQKMLSPFYSPEGKVERRGLSNNSRGSLSFCCCLHLPPSPFNSPLSEKVPSKHTQPAAAVCYCTTTRYTTRGFRVDLKWAAVNCGSVEIFFLWILRSCTHNKHTPRASPFLRKE